MYKIQSFTMGQRCDISVLSPLPLETLIFLSKRHQRPRLAKRHEDEARAILPTATCE